MLVTLSFEKDGVNYRIERGRKPTLMRFFVDDIEQEGEETDDAQGDMRETQKDIDELFGMSHDMFKHIVALNTYTEPFLSMRANDQRVIIEQLLGITILSEKAETLKELVRQTKDAITQESADIEATKKANEGIQKSIDSLLTRQTAWNSQHNTELEKIGRAIIELESVDIEAELAKHSELKLFEEKTAKLKSLNKERATLDSAIAQAERSVTKYDRELGLLASKTCHACEQELHDHKHEEMTALAQGHLEEARKYHDKVEKDLAKIIKEIETIGEVPNKPVTYYDTVEQALKHQNNLKSLESQLEVKAGESDPYQEQIDELRDTALQEINWEAVNDLTKLKDHQ
jgi:DNA repair exonuclease SbcCD ATPase subunit